MKYEDKILDALVKNHGREKRYNKVTFKLILSLSLSHTEINAHYKQLSLSRFHLSLFPLPCFPFPL